MTRASLFLFEVNKKLALWTVLSFDDQRAFEARFSPLEIRLAKYAVRGRKAGLSERCVDVSSVLVFEVCRTILQTKKYPGNLSISFGVRI